MSRWIVINVTSEYIGTKTERFTKIFVPFDSLYAGYSTELSNKLIREYHDSYTISVRPDFEILLELITTDENGNYITVDTKIITGKQFAELFQTS